MSDDRSEAQADDGEALEREFADVLGALRGFEPVTAPVGLEERIAMKLKVTKDTPAELAEADAGASRGREPGVSLRCVFCHEGLARAEGAFCASCLAPHHPECFREHGRCSALGCEETRWVQPRDRGRRASGRTGRMGGTRERRAPALALVSAAVLAGVVGVAAVRLVNAPVAVPARDEQAMFEDYKRLEAEGMKAFRAFNQADKDGNVALAAAKRKEAQVLWGQAIDVLNGILDAHKGPNGFTLPEYEGYEEELSRVATHLVDLEKRAYEPSRSGLTDAPAWVARARQRLERGDLAGARADLDRARALDPTCVEAEVLLAELEALAPVTAPARPDRPDAGAFDETDVRALVARARQRLEAGRFVEARMDLHRARMLDPRSPEIQALLSEVEAVASGAAVVSSASTTDLLDGLKVTVVEVEELLRGGHTDQAQRMIDQGRTILRMLEQAPGADLAELRSLEGTLDRFERECQADSR